MKKNFDQLGDTELFYLLKSDKATSEKAFAELYARHSARLYAYCRRFLGDKDEAQDVFQETFVRFYQSGTQERLMTNVPAFLLKIARNLCVNSKRRDKNSIAFDDYMAVDDSARSDKSELLDLIKMAIDLLHPEYREIFILREYQGLSYSEIADLTEVSLATVKIRIFRAKQKIREILAPYLSDLSKY
jgi:RNA polymerase sigma-70 factor (ECF subfamily)